MIVLAKLLGRIGIPKRFRRAATWAAVAAGVCLLGWWWLDRHDARVIGRHEAEVKAEVAERASNAAADATEAVADTKGRVEDGNAAARKAAEGSGDPLADGLRALNK